MPAELSVVQDHQLPDHLPFPPVTKSHIRNCAVPSWYSRYRTLIPKTRVIPLNKAFVSYLQSDGIVLPDDGTTDPEWDDGDAEQATPPYFEEWSHIHSQINDTIKELGGRVHPKLNWSAPKDATWMSAANTMECQSANDIYLLLKSSDFVTHDLQQAYYGCEGAAELNSEDDIEYSLVLRKSVTAMINSMEFRCFVRGRRLIAICQRDINHYDFMASLIPTLQDVIYDFFHDHLSSFPDENFVFDTYVPRPKEGGKVWLIDINPWAPRTDPLLYSWLELLTRPELPEAPSIDLAEEIVRLHLQPNRVDIEDNHVDSGYDTADVTEDEVEEDDEEDVEIIPAHYPEFRIVKRDDPETYSFNTPLYSAHKLPKDIVDASKTIDGEGGMRDFLTNWKEKIAEMESGTGQDSDSDV